MPTLINYNQATFKNHAKPNQRRLQELQHSAARAHAARVAYWRKKGTSLPEPESPDRRKSKEVIDPTGLSTSTSNAEQEADKGDGISSQRGSRSSEEIHLTSKIPSSKDARWRRRQKKSPLSSSLVTTPHQDSTTTMHKWRLISNPASSYDDNPKLTRLPTTHLFDPFDTTPSRQEAEVVAAMDHYIHNWAPSQMPGLKYQTKDNPLIRDVFPAALQNVELFEAAVALCLSFKAAGQNFQRQTCNWSLYHKGRALSGIQAKLKSGCVDEAIILATVFLMIIDNVFLDVHAYETHLFGLRKMAEAFKPASSKELFGGSLLSFIAWAESNALLLFGNRIALPKTSTDGARLEYPIHPFPSTLTILVGTLTPGFQSVALDGQLSAEVLSILAKTTRWTNCIDPDPGQSPSGTHQAFLMNFDPRANSAELMRLCRVAGEEHVVETAICKAVYIYHANLLGWTCRCSGYRQVVKELVFTLRTWELREVWDRDLWTWLALITANAARRGKLQSLQTEVMTSLFISEGATRNWEFWQGIMKQFLFHSQLGREWKSCWNMAKPPAA